MKAAITGNSSFPPTRTHPGARPLGWEATAIDEPFAKGHFPGACPGRGRFLQPKFGRDQVNKARPLSYARSEAEIHPMNALSRLRSGGLRSTSMKIASGVSVELEYELKVKGGAVLESSSRSGPLRYVHGSGKMLPGLEKRLDGLGPGDERAGEIPAREAFGTEEMLPVKEMPRARVSRRREARGGRDVRRQRSGARFARAIQDPLDQRRRRARSGCCTRWSAAIWNIASRCSRCAIPTSGGFPRLCQVWSSSTR